METMETTLPLGWLPATVKTYFCIVCHFKCQMLDITQSEISFEQVDLIKWPWLIALLSLGFDSKQKHILYLLASREWKWAHYSLKKFNLNYGTSLNIVMWLYYCRVSRLWCKSQHKWEPITFGPCIKMTSEPQGFNWQARRKSVAVRLQTAVSRVNQYSSFHWSSSCSYVKGRSHSCLSSFKPTYFACWLFYHPVICTN